MLKLCEGELVEHIYDQTYVLLSDGNGGGGWGGRGSSSFWTGPDEDQRCCRSPGSKLTETSADTSTKSQSSDRDPLYAGTTCLSLHSWFISHCGTCSCSQLILFFLQIFSNLLYFEPTTGKPVFAAEQWVFFLILSFLLYQNQTDSCVISAQRHHQTKERSRDGFLRPTAALLAKTWRPERSKSPYTTYKPSQ